MPNFSLAAIDSLTPYANNTRTHSESQIQQLARSIQEFGFVGAIVIRNGTIAKGHGCLAAVKQLYAEWRSRHRGRK